MAKKLAPVPKGYRTATPYLIVSHAPAALDFYQDAFGAEVLSRVESDEGLVIHAEIKIGNSVIRLADENPAFGILSPTSIGGTATAIHLYMPKAEAVWENAVEAGATVLLPMTETYWGEMYGRLIDPFGHVWSVSRRLDSSERTPVPSEAEIGPVAEAEAVEEVVEDQAVEAAETTLDAQVA